LRPDDEFQVYHLAPSYLPPDTNFTASEALAVLILCYEVGGHYQMPFLAPGGALDFRVSVSGLNEIS
jgi:hypothetical protein